MNETEIAVGGTLCLGDVLRFSYFYMLRRTWWFVGLVAAIFLVVLLMMATVVVIGGEYEPVLRNSIPILLVLLLWMFAFGVCPYLGARRQMKTSASMREPIVYVFLREGFRSTGGYSKGEVSWGAVWRVLESKSAFYLCYSAGNATLLPKRFFCDVEEQQRWRKLVEAGISPKRIVAPGFVGRWL